MLDPYFGKEKFFKSVETVVNKYYGTVQKEKYSSAIIKFYFSEAIKREGNKKLGKNAIIRIENYIRNKLQTNYGPWANVWLTDKLGVGYNIDQIYKTDKGNLYSGYTNHTEGLLITSHAISRFEERYTDHLLTNEFLKKSKSIRKSTALDRLLLLLAYIKIYHIDKNSVYTNDFEHGNYYVWCWPGNTESKFCGGIFVIEKLLADTPSNTVFIIKTFLPESAANNICNNWKNDIPPKEFNNVRNWLLSL